MKGSVRKRYNNAWSYRIDLGFVDGKRKQVEKGGFKTEREATKAMQDVLYHLNNTGDYVENKKISFHIVYEEFIEREGKATRAYATLKKYDSLYQNHIKDEFGPLYVYQISDTMIIDFLNQKRLKYSEEYVKGLYKFFNVILRYAHDHKYTKKNAMDLVPPPPDPRHVGDIVTYSRKELEQMIERIESTRSKIAFQLGLQAGLRESESSTGRVDSSSVQNVPQSVSERAASSRNRTPRLASRMTSSAFSPRFRSVVVVRKVRSSSAFFSSGKALAFWIPVEMLCSNTFPRS